MVYRNRKGEIITMAEWRALLDDDAYRQVAEKKVGDAIVSTVWVGHEPLRDWENRRLARPMTLFETMVISDYLPDWVWRTGTEEEALMAHERMVKKVRRYS